MNGELSASPKPSGKKALSESSLFPGIASVKGSLVSVNGMSSPWPSFRDGQQPRPR